MYSKQIQFIIRGIKTGDEIRVTTESKRYEGVLMPSTDLGDPDHIIIKLKNGYNVGLKYEPTMKAEKISFEFKESSSEMKAELGKRKKVEKMSFDKTKPLVSLITTGGTIASRIDYKTGGVTGLMNPDEMLSSIPELAGIINLTGIKSPFTIMSEDMNHEHWQEIAKETASELKKSEGVIITQGTDTLHFTAAALSFMLPDVPKPVVLTASQRSSDRPSSDAFMNLVCSAYAAISDIASVGTCMHATSSDDYCYFIRGTKTRKLHTSSREAFKPVNDLPLANIWPNGKIEITNDRYSKRRNAKVKLDVKYDDNIALLKWYAGADPGILDYYEKKGVKGIVIEGNGLGHVSVHGKKAWTPAIKSIVDSGVPVFVAPHMLYGRINPHVYSNLRELYHVSGAVPLEDMLPETAYVKLGWVLGHTHDAKKAKEMMLKNYAREISERTLPETFLY